MDNAELVRAAVVHTAATKKEIDVAKAKVKSASLNFESPIIKDFFVAAEKAEQLEVKEAQLKHKEAKVRESIARGETSAAEQTKLLKKISLTLAQIEKAKGAVGADNGTVSLDEKEDIKAEAVRLQVLKEEHTSNLETAASPEEKSRLSKALEAITKGEKELANKIKAVNERESGGIKGVKAQAKYMIKGALGEKARNLSPIFDMYSEHRETNKQAAQRGETQKTVKDVIAEKANELTGGLTGAFAKRKAPVVGDITDIINDNTKPGASIPEGARVGIDAATETVVDELKRMVKDGELTIDSMKEIEKGILEVVSNTSEIKKALDAQLELNRDQAVEDAAKGKVGKERSKAVSPKTNESKIPPILDRAKDEPEKPSLLDIAIDNLGGDKNKRTRDPKTGRYRKAPTPKVPSSALSRLGAFAPAVLGTLGTSVGALGLGTVAAGVGAAGLAGYGAGTLAYNNSETVRDASGSAMESLFGHVKTTAELDKERKASPEYIATMQSSDERRKTRNAEKLEVVSTKLDQKSKENETKASPNITVQAPAPVIIDNRKDENRTVRNNDNSFIRITDKQMSAAWV